MSDQAQNGDDSRRQGGPPPWLTDAECGVVFCYGLNRLRLEAEGFRFGTAPSAGQRNESSRPSEAP